MPPEKAPQSGPETKPAQPKTAPEAAPAPAEKPTDAIKSLGEKIADTFKTKDGLKGYVDEFKKIIDSTFSQFTKDFQANFSKSDGKADMSEILSLFGLDKLLAPFLTPDKATPDKSATTGTTASSSPSTQPQALRNTAAAGAVAGTPSSATQATTSATTTTPSFTLSTPTDTPNIQHGKCRIPENPGTITGTEFMRRANQLGDMNDKANQRKMEILIEQLVDMGCIPSFCRPENGKKICMSDGKIKVTFRAALNYLAIGTDKDYRLVPITAILAQRLSLKYNWGLPTGPMTDEIYNKADIKLRGIGYLTGKPGSRKLHEQNMEMQRNTYLERHDADIKKMLGPEGLAKLQNGELADGHKKAIIASAIAVGNPNGPLDFRGLYTDGKHPTQYNPSHEHSYRDYAQGFRAIGGDVEIESEETGHKEMRSYYDALRDPKIGNILNRGTGTYHAKDNGRGTGAFDARMAYVDPRRQPNV